MRFASSSLLAFTFLFACGGEDTPPPDSGADRDGGPVVRDGGEPTRDGGEPTPDGGETTPDGGETTPDGGETTPDGGAATPDGGSTGRTIVTEHCARTFGSCSNDSECTTGGCGGELCASEELFTTCDCTAPAASCGCVGGSCVWYR